MIRVKVPATSANLGPGFDFLGLALELYNIVEYQPASSWQVTAEGYGAESLSGRTDLLVCQAVRRVYEELGQTITGARIHLINEIPDIGGLGSSAAAIVGGLAAANTYLGNPFSRQDLLVMATELEGHPDNVAPAIFGGLTGVFQKKDERLQCFPIPVPSDLRVVLVLPELKVSTFESRRLLPEKVNLSDAVFNLVHTGLLVGAFFSGQTELLCEAMEDRLHQPPRSKLIPGFYNVLDAAYKGGAFGAALSGSGPTVIAFSHEDKITTVGEAMVEAFNTHNIKARWQSAAINTSGFIIK